MLKNLDPILSPDLFLERIAEASSRLHLPGRHDLAAENGPADTGGFRDRPYAGQGDRYLRTLQIARLVKYGAGSTAFDVPVSPWARTRNVLWRLTTHRRVVLAISLIDGLCAHYSRHHQRR